MKDAVIDAQYSNLRLDRTNLHSGLLTQQPHQIPFKRLLKTGIKLFRHATSLANKSRFTGEYMLDFILKHRTLPEILMDHKLAALGDAYVNFLFSLAESERKGEPIGVRVDNNLLAVAFRKAELREFLPPRTSRHEQADAAEALIVYAWIRGAMTIEEGVNILKRCDDTPEAFCRLILAAKEEVNL